MRADDRIAQLTERIAELESDAARYLYLKTMFSPMGINIDGNHTWTFLFNDEKAALDALEEFRSVWGGETV